MKRIMIILAGTVLMGCSSAAVSGSVSESSAEPETSAAPEYEYHDAYAPLGEDLLTGWSEFEFIEYHCDDKDYMYENSEDVVIGHALSLDRGSNVLETTGEYTYPYTVGTFTVLKSIKGDLKEGSVYVYARTGGIITADEYYAQYPDNKDKVEHMTGSNHDYFAMFPIGINKIEPGKSYLMYINKSDRFIEDTYYLFGLEGALREIGEIFPEDYSGVKVLNNYTGEWEDLTDIIPG